MRVRGKGQGDMGVMCVCVCMGREVFEHVCVGQGWGGLPGDEL